MELHGGRIWAESPGKGKGATFFVELPLAPAIAVLAESRGRDDDKQTAPVQGLRLLVVEDEPGAREALASLLRSAGARVATAGSVGEALDLLERERFDVMVSDTVERVQETTAAVQNTILKPVREVNGLVSGVRAALTALARGNRASVDHATQDEEMFI